MHPTDYSIVHNWPLTIINRAMESLCFLDWLPCSSSAFAAIGWSSRWSRRPGRWRLIITSSLVIAMGLGWCWSRDLLPTCSDTLSGCKLWTISWCRNRRTNNSAISRPLCLLEGRGLLASGGRESVGCYLVEASCQIIEWIVSYKNNMILNHLKNNS